MKTPFFIYLQETIAYHAQTHDVCTCAYCENFRLAFKDHFLIRDERLKTFGFNLDGELEIMDLFWNESRTKRVYEIFFAIKGELFEDGFRFDYGDSVVTLYRVDSHDLLYNLTEMKPPCFFLVLRVELPWLLAEMPKD